MISFSRSSRGMLANWWWTVDKLLLMLIAILLGIGAILSISASTAVSNNLGRGQFYFILKQAMFLPLAIGGMLFLSMLGLKSIRRIAVVGYLIAMVLLVWTLFFGYEVKGAKRWINFGFFSLQPSEFIKPTFIVVTAWLLEAKRRYQDFPGYRLSIGLFVVTAFLLWKQPDLGMTFVVAAIWVMQLFLAGIPWKYVFALGGTGVIGAVATYFLQPHMRDRIAQYFASENNLSYQVSKSLAAFENGGIFGVGPGEGVVKMHIPDAHTDFVFAVAAEEYGMILCLGIVVLYAAIVIRTMVISCKDNNLFIILSTCGLVASFGLQSIINIGSTMHLLPTKGMALPLISCGGSSLLGMAVTMGMLLAITRKNVSAEEKDEEA